MDDPLRGRLHAPPRKESAIQTEILRLLRARGIMAYPLNRERAGRKRASHIGVKGLPDIGGWVTTQIDAGVVHGQARLAPYPAPLYIEVKRPGQKLRPEQAAFLALARKAGCIAFLATSCEDVAKAMGWQ